MTKRSDEIFKVGLLKMLGSINLTLSRIEVENERNNGNGNPFSTLISDQEEAMANIIEDLKDAYFEEWDGL